MCKIAVFSADGLVLVIVMFELGLVGVRSMGGCDGSSLFVGIISVVDMAALVGVNVGVCDSGVIVF